MSGTGPVRVGVDLGQGGCRAVARYGRSTGHAATPGFWTGDTDARIADAVAGALADLTSYQFDLLVAMAERAGRVLTRDQIMEAVRGRELEAFDRSIDVHMGRLRKKIEGPGAPLIHTIRGSGYVLGTQD